MKLKEYLDSKKIKMIDFAAQMGVGYNQMCLWCRGAKNPSEEMKKRIQLETKRKVTLADWENQ